MADTQIGRILGSRYRVDSLIEDAKFAGIYRGTNTVVDRPVTIKIVSPAFVEFKQQVFDEARKVSRISHPNVLSVADLGEDNDGTLFVVYEPVEGESLKSALARKEQLPVDRSIEIIRQAVAASSSVYPVIPAYGSLKTENILISADDPVPRVKVLNFFDRGTFRELRYDASLVSDADEVSSVAPELLTSDSADERSDVYTLGSLLFRMLAGEFPFSTESISATLEKINNGPPSPLSSYRADLPDGLERVILTAMAKNPEMRYQTVAEFSNELEGFVSLRTVDAETSVETPKQDIWKTAFVVLAGISLLTVALIYATSVKQTDPTTQLQPDANGQPVQPINPATGVQEQALANMQAMSGDPNANANMSIPPGTLPGGDNYDPWKNGGQPPPGAPKGGQVVTVDPNSPSVFMPPEGCIPQPSGILLCPVPVNKAAKPTPTPKINANANVQVTSTPRPTPETKSTPEKPAVKPTPVKPQGTTPSGKPKNGDEDLN